MCTSPAMQRVQPSPRAARKSEWLRSALAHHHCSDPGVENEIVVLATGIDQYLQEVFHHLAFPSRDDTVSAKDFTALCAVLGLNRAEVGKRTANVKETAGAGEREEEDEEFKDICSGLPSQLSFKEFHSRLCGYFRVRSARRGTGECALRLPVSEDTELVERQIRLRWPRVRRRKCVSFDLTKDQNGPINTSVKGRTSEHREPDEVAALRELVEDLRSALQGSDARCLALEVALRQERSSTLPSASCYNPAISKPKTSITFIQGKLVPTQRIKGQLSSAAGDSARRVARKRDIRDPLLRELKLIRSSRDGQLEEAIRFNKHLEEELQWAYQEVRKLQGVEAALRKENTQIRKRAEEAREALSSGLQQVRLIQEQARSVPQLQSRITQLETELHRYRTSCTCVPSPAGQQNHPEDTCSKTVALSTDAECLQRAVEGRAASDEEEEDSRMREEEQRCLMEVKRHIGRMHGCSKGCQDHVVHHLLSQSQMYDRNLSSTSKGNRGHFCWKGPNQEQPQGGFKQASPEEEEERTQEENEKTRLSLLEGKLTDSLALLLQLRNKNMSGRGLGKMVMDTLDVCSRGGAAFIPLSPGPSQILQVADSLSVR
ncbi:EF-hand and coiled-coil domain-containing protein 1 isoform X1 [Oreochromis niloticus]|uniref:EF-hand and coiled-coil domain-containing protein 1 isoform X1 n=1 Tax=Oreochromis niloticus TaxID=8128 RepID=UPI000393CC59|nr:EF-hand and coiled-coil domain-containing protein 1 isoform X1 [Oreochromis niloticus]